MPLTRDEELATRLSGGVAELEPAILDALRAERARCRWICERRAELQRIRAAAESNAVATERALEAEGCARDIDALDVERAGT